MKKPTDKTGTRNLTPSLSDLNDIEREQRLRALRSMLAATEARQKLSQGKRVRRQILAAGLKVQVRSGVKKGQEGVILDADYIQSRVLVELLGVGDDTWVNFTDVSPVISSDEE